MVVVMSWVKFYNAVGLGLVLLSCSLGCSMIHYCEAENAKLINLELITASNSLPQSSDIYMYIYI